MSKAEKTLRDFLEKVLDERGYKQREVEIKEINSGGNNYTSVLFTIIVKTSDEELRLFAKVADMTLEIREMLNSKDLFKTEKFVYNKLIHLYNDLQKDLDEEHKFIFPEFYGFHEELGNETVILENLVENGYKPYSRFMSMDWDHGRVGVEALARYHALSFALRKRDPKYFEEITTSIEYRWNINMLDENSLYEFVKMVESPAKFLNDDHLDKVRRCIYRIKVFEKYKQPLSTPVIAHGDYKLSNLLFKRKGHDLKAKVVDYQTVHTGCPVADLFYFIFLGSDENFRRLYFDKLVNHYYTSLVEALKRLSVDPVEVYPREKFESDVKESYPFVVMLALMVLPMIVVEAEFAPKWNSDVESPMSTKFSVIYEERFRGIINDLVRWEVI